MKLHHWNLFIAGLIGGMGIFQIILGQWVWAIIDLFLVALNLTLFQINQKL